MKHSFRITILLLVASLTILVGCTGDKGDPGEDAIGVDTRPPSIILEQPVHGDTLYDFLTAEALVTDNAGIDHVEFYLNGQDEVNDSTLSHVFIEPWSYEYALSQLRLQWGPQTFSARAIDLAGNTTQTSPILIYYFGAQTSGTVTLSNFDSLAAFERAIYLETEERDTLTDTTYLRIDYPFVRFNPNGNCKIEEINIFFDAVGDTMRGMGLTVEVLPSNGAIPVFSEGALHSFPIPSGNLGTPGWFRHTVPLEIDVITDQPFHVILIAEDYESSSSWLSLRAQTVDHYPSPINNNSGLWSLEEGRYVLHQETVSSSESVYEFWVEAVVTYGEDFDGEE